MSAAKAHLKDIDKVLPVSPFLERFRDPRNETVYEGYRIAVHELTEDDWTWILADVRSRWPESPANLRETIELQGGFPIRKERVSILEIDPRFVMPGPYEESEEYEDAESEDWE